MEPRLVRALRSVMLVAPLVGLWAATREKKDMRDMKCTLCTTAWALVDRKRRET